MSDIIEKNYKKDMKKLKQMKNRFDKLLSQYGNIYKTHTHEIFKDLKKIQLDDYYGEVVELKNCNIKCPSGFDKVETDTQCKCIKFWNSNCGESCAKKKCDDAKLNWMPLDYAHNPYTCEEFENNDSTTSYFINGVGKLQKLDNKTKNNKYCNKTPQTTNNYLNGFLRNNNFTLGNPLKGSEPCEINFTNNSYSKNIKNINTQLINLATDIYNKIVSIQKNKKKVESETSADEKQLRTDLSNYSSFIKKFKNIRNHSPTVNAMREDTRLRATSQYNQYLLWTLLVIITIIYTIYHLRKK